MLLTDTPNIIKRQLQRIKAKAISDSATDIVISVNNFPSVYWINVPQSLNKCIDIIKEYQLILEDGDVQDKLDSLGIIYWHNYFLKVKPLVELIDLIENL